jgi:GTP-binding protein HflX
MGQGLAMSRLGGGIGTRGPGETKLEVDRRHIRSRIAYLKTCLDKIKTVRDLHKIQRQKKNVPTVCLVGYTNAGKSTLLNKLTDSHIYVQDQLFATLDPTTRQLSLPDNQKAVLTDTVGFIQRLPHQLVAAFKSTLEVVQDADLLIHVVDLSHPLYKEQSQAVYSVLKELKAGEKNILTVYNKIDLLPKGDGLLERLKHDEECVCISAATGLGIDNLLKAISERLRMQVVEATYLFPYANNNILSNLYKDCTIIDKEYLEEGTLVRVRINLKDADPYKKFIHESETKSK